MNEPGIEPRISFLESDALTIELSIHLTRSCGDTGLYKRMITNGASGVSHERLTRFPKFFDR